MIRRSVLAAFAEGIAAGRADVARAAVRRTEWLLRRSAKRRLEKALLYAKFATADKGGAPDAETERHLQRVAALDVAGVVIDALERDQVIEAYAALPRGAPGGVPVATICAAAAMLVGIAGLVWFVWLRPVEDEPAVATPSPVPLARNVRPRPPPAVGAFVDGGAPLRDQELEKLFVDDFTDYVLEIDRERSRRSGRGAERVQHGAALAAAPAIARRGEKLAAAWRELLDVLDRWSEAPSGGPAFEDIAQEVRDKARVMSDQLAAAGIGYYLEGIVRSSSERASATVYTYLVEEVVFVVAGGEARRVLSVRRLDQLNRSWALLGMHSEELGDPIVLLDKIDEHVVTTLLPVLAADARYPLSDPQIDAEAGRAVRSELAPLSGDPASAAVIGGLLAERAALVAGWRTQLARQGRSLSRLESLYLPEQLLESLSRNGRVSEREIVRVRAIDRRLAELRADALVANLTDRVAASVRRHEARHGMDADRHPPLRYPTALEAYLGPEHDDDGTPRRRVRRARLELAAYLSQIANDTKTTQMTLWHLARAAFDPGGSGSVETYAAKVIVEGLARHVAGATAALEVGPFSDRAGLHPHAHVLAKATATQLRAAADALWRELYDEPPLAIVDR